MLHGMPKAAAAEKLKLSLQLLFNDVESTVLR